MANLLYSEGWLIVALALGASFACWRNARKIANLKRGIRYTKALVCLLMAVFTSASLIGWLPGTIGLLLLLACLSSLLLSLIAREIIEAPLKVNEHH